MSEDCEYISLMLSNILAYLNSAPYPKDISVRLEKINGDVIDSAYIQTG